MPHAHRARRSSTFVNTDMIENTIERLLAQGARISDALENEVQYAEQQYGDTPKRDCRASTASESGSSIAEQTSKASSSKSSSKANSDSSVTSGKSPASSARVQRRVSSMFHHCPGVPGWPPAPPSDLSHTYDLDDVPSLPCSQTSVTNMSRMSNGSGASWKSRGSSASSSCETNKEDITSDMLEPPAPSVKSDAKNTVNDAMPKPNDVFLGMKHFPCYIRERDTTFERSARVTMHRRAEGQWIVLCVDVEGPAKEKLVIVRCEVLGRLVRNVFINGNRAE